MFRGPSSNRLPYRELLDLFISDMTSQLRVDEVYREGQRRHIAFTPVNTATAVVRDAHLAARDYFAARRAPGGRPAAHPGRALPARGDALADRAARRRASASTTRRSTAASWAFRGDAATCAEAAVRDGDRQTTRRAAGRRPGRPPGRRVHRRHGGPLDRPLHGPLRRRGDQGRVAPSTRASCGSTFRRGPPSRAPSPSCRRGSPTGTRASVRRPRPARGPRASSSPSGWWPAPTSSSRTTAPA